MNRTVDYSSNAPENVVHAAEAIGSSGLRRSVFAAIYRGKRRRKSVSALMTATGYSRKQVLTAGKYLADKLVVQQYREDGETEYEKIDFIHRHKAKILSLAASPSKRDKVPTKRTPRVAGTSHTRLPADVKVTIRTRGLRDAVKHITLDDISTFARVKAIRSGDYLGDTLTEEEFKEGFRRILGEAGQFRDWGGEQQDLFTTKVALGGKRRSLAIAFKGPGASGRLTPKKMGKNGDQIQRLFQSPAEVFLVQYGEQIDPSVLTQMQQFAIVRALAGETVYYGIIDGSDSLRLVKAYPRAFANQKRREKRKARRR